jgi:tetratricopeptide (TPR) repeat protein
VLLQEALRRLPPSDSSQRVMLLGRLAEELYYTEDVERRLSLSGEAVDMARRLGDPASLVSALCSRCLTLWDPDHVHERRRIAQQVVDVAEGIEDRELQLFGRHHLYVAQLEIGDGEGARATLRAFRKAAEQLRQPLYRWQACLLAALQAIVEGAWSDAERLATEALEIGQRAGDPDAMPIFAVQLGTIRLEQGRIAEVADAVTAMANEFARWPAWRVGEALVAAEMGRREEAAASFEALAADGFRRIPRDFTWLGVLAMLTLTCSLLGFTDRAPEIYRLLLPFSRYNAMLADRSYWGSVSHYLGVLAVMSEQWAAADTHFRASADANRRMGALPWVAHTLHEHARMLALRAGPGDRKRASWLLEEAREFARSLGMAGLRQRIESAAEQL